MYFFFFYFLAEINPLSILLISTYIRPHANSTKPPPTPPPQNTYSVVASPRIEKQRMSVQSIFNRGKRSGSGGEYQSVLYGLVLLYSFYLINHKRWIYSCRLSLVQKRECNIYIECLEQETNIKKSLTLNTSNSDDDNRDNETVKSKSFTENEHKNHTDEDLILLTTSANTYW